jgi:hypothetical protein
MILCAAVNARDDDHVGVDRLSSRRRRTEGHVPGRVVGSGPEEVAITDLRLGTALDDCADLGTLPISLHRTGSPLTPARPCANLEQIPQLGVAAT